MTYRCRYCVYAEILDRKVCDMKCLKHDKIVKCMDNHCEDLILEPRLFLSHLFIAHNRELFKQGKISWSDADTLADSYLIKYGFAGMTKED